MLCFPAFRHDSANQRGGGLLVDLALALLLVPLPLIAGLNRWGGDLGNPELHVGEVGVLVDYMEREARVIATPGFVPHLPYLRELIHLSRSPLTLRMAGNERVNALHVPRLMVRARDGSSYAFETTVVEFALDAARADLALVDGGQEHGLRAELCHLIARAILRDELEHLSAEEVMDSDALYETTETARAKIAAALDPHGIELLQVSISGAKFTPEYEQAIERREIGEQEIDHLAGQLEQLAEERRRQEASARREGELKLARQRGTHQRDLVAARVVAIHTRRKADVRQLERLRAAESDAFEASSRAVTLRARHEAEAALFEAELERLARSEGVAVREALIERLSDIELRIVPFSSQRGED